MALFNILKAIIVRVFLLLHILVTIWRVTLVYGDIFYLLFLGIVPFILEGVYTVIKREGIEWKWFCPCFILYLLATIPSIWLLEINRTGLFGSINTTSVEDISIRGITIPIKMPADTWVLVIEECLLYFMIVGRWLLPRGNVSREQLSELLFTFIGIASDIMELFALFDEEPVRGNIVFTYALLSIWSCSLFQFTMVLTVASKPIRINVIDHDDNIEPEKKKSLASLTILATLVSLCLQDGPFLGMRLYTIVAFNLVNYSLIFFTTKNVLVIMLLVYRLYGICMRKCCPETEPKNEVSDTDLRLKNLRQQQDATEEKIYAILHGNVNELRKRKQKTHHENSGACSGGHVSDMTTYIIEPEDLPNELHCKLGSNCFLNKMVDPETPHTNGDGDVKQEDSVGEPNGIDNTLRGDNHVNDDKLEIPVLNTEVPDTPDIDSSEPMEIPSSMEDTTNKLQDKYGEINITKGEDGHEGETDHNEILLPTNNIFKC